MFDPVFLKGETWGFPGAAVEHLETHAANVFLVGDRAFKLKKAAKLPYLDFSTPYKRHETLAREFEINRLFTPDLYIGLTQVSGETVLVMRRFASGALLAWQVQHGGVDDALAVQLAEMVAAAHAKAPRRPASGVAIMMGVGAQLSQAFTSAPDIFPPDETLSFHAICEAALKKDPVLLEERSERGAVHRCHGDMHCGNIIVEEGVPKLFDAIEFSEAIATVDVLHDLAFLLMDLRSKGERRAANILLNRYLALRRAEEDLTGLAAMPLFLAMRAGIRAVVCADLSRDLTPAGSLQPRSQTRDWFRTAMQYLNVGGPVLVCIGGLSGTGKSTAAAALAPQLGASPGAIHVRSDVERKVLAGVAETQRLEADHYTPEASAAVYRACLDRAGRALKAGHSVVLDAVFARPEERRAAEECASKSAARFVGVWLEAPGEVLAERVAARQGDASDATADVVAQQMRYDLGSISWVRLSAAGCTGDTLKLFVSAVRP